MTEEIRPKGKLEQIIEQHGKKLMIAGIAFVVLVGGWYWYNNMHLPKKAEAANKAIFMVERYFEKDSITAVYNGAGESLGGLDVISKYGNTKAGARAHYMVGRTLMKEDKFEEALAELKQADFDDEFMAPLTMCLIGDCYSELKQYETAAEKYWKAATMRDNDYSTPRCYLKAALVYEQLGNWEKALEAYEIIKADYAETPMGKDIQKYISRAETRIGQ